MKCGSCRDVCPENAIELLDEVRPAYLLEGAVHRYAMAPRPVELGTAQQMVDTMRLRMRGSDIFEREALPLPLRSGALCPSPAYRNPLLRLAGLFRCGAIGLMGLRGGDPGIERR